MPILDPRNSGLPADWRSAYDEYRKLKGMASKLGLSTGGWAMEYPSRARSAFDPRWKLTYSTLSGTMTTIYLGSNGTQAAATIAEIAKPYLKARRIQMIKADKAMVGMNAQGDPRRNTSTVVTYYRKLQEFMRNGGHHAPAHPSAPRHPLMKDKPRWPWTAMAAYDPELAQFMRMRAGYLAMSMIDYLWHHPHGRRYPIPPRNEEEMNRRQNEMAQEADRQESARRQERAESPVEIDPVWGIPTKDVPIPPKPPGVKGIPYTPTPEL